MLQRLGKIIYYIREHNRRYIEEVEKPLKVPRQLSAEQIFLFAMFGALNVFDYFMTILGYQLTDGGIEETNQLFAPLLENGDLFPFMLLKFIIAGILMIMVYFRMIHAGKSYNLIRAAWMLIVTFYILVIFNNLIQLNLVSSY